MAHMDRCNRFETNFTAGAVAVKEHFALGREAVERCEKARRACQYGSGKKAPKAIARLAQERCLSRSLVDQARKVASVYSDEEVDVLLDRFRESEMVPLIGYFEQLALIQTAEERAEWEDQLVENAWSYRQFRVKLREHCGKKRERRSCPREKESSFELAVELEANGKRLLSFIDQLPAFAKDPDSAWGRVKLALRAAVPLLKENMDNHTRTRQLERALANERQHGLL
jgi:hypothetical protein